MGVVRGDLSDVALKSRQSSSTLGQWKRIELIGINRKQLWVPIGLAHGFIVISGSAELFYKTTEYYAQYYERCLGLNDKTLAIDWPINGVEPTLSTKDDFEKMLSYLDLNYYLKYKTNEKINQCRFS